MAYKARSRSLGSLMWVAPALILLGVFAYYPIVENVRLSFFSWSAFKPNPIFVGLQNYKDAAADPIFWTALRNNGFYAVTSIAVQVFGALALAALLEAFIGPRLRQIFRSIYFLPALVSITVSAILFQFIYDPNLGLLNSFLRLVGLGGIATTWLGHSATAIWGVIAMSQWQSLGYTTMLYLVAIQRIPREFYEAAQVDGAGKLRQFWAITVPQVREMTTFLLILTMSGAFLVFNEVLVMTNGGPNNSSQVLGSYLYQSAFQHDDMGYAAMLGTVLFVVAFVLAIAQLVYSRMKPVES